MFYIIANPISGRKKSNYERIKEIYKYLDENKIEYKLFESGYVNHPNIIAKEICQENPNGGDLIVIGGDGTFNEVINGLDDLKKWNIGLIPAGSGNDFAKCIHLEKDLISNLKRILNKEVHKFDYINVNNKRCVNVLGTGIDVEVLLNFEKHTKLKGSLRYFVSLVEAAFKLNFHEFDVSLDDGEFVHKKGFLVVLANGSHIGGGIPICPGAIPNDGKLEFVFVKPIKRYQLPKYLLGLMKGKIHSWDITEHVYCTKAVFKDNKKLFLQIDGNISKDFEEYRCEIVNNGLNMYL